ncbi:MAG: hypothetical protein H9W81_07990 [Enterococcus sp.]|nr:hypothetical protein [Enterococcus sp.]
MSKREDIEEVLRDIGALLPQISEANNIGAETRSDWAMQALENAYGEMEEALSYLSSQKK